MKIPSLRECAVDTGTQITDSPSDTIWLYEKDFVLIVNDKLGNYIKNLTQLPSS